MREGVVCTSSDTSLWTAERSLGACADKSGRALTFFSLGGLIVGGWWQWWWVVWSFAAAVQSATFLLYSSQMVFRLFVSPPSRTARPPVHETRDAASGEGSRCDTTQNILARTVGFSSPSFSSAVSLPLTLLHSLAAVKIRRRGFVPPCAHKLWARECGSPLSADWSLRAAPPHSKSLPTCKMFAVISFPPNASSSAEKESGEKMQKMTMIWKLHPSQAAWEEEGESGREKFPRKRKL